MTRSPSIGRRSVAFGLGVASAAGCGGPPAAPKPSVPFSAPAPQRDPEADAVTALGADFVAQVRKAGGRATARPSGPAWNAPVAWNVTLSGKGVTDADLAGLARFKGKIHDLDLRETGVTAGGLGPFDGFDLASLELPPAARTDAAALPYLRSLGRLENVSFAHWMLTDEGLRALAEPLPATDADDLPHRSAVARVFMLDLSSTQVTDAGVAWLAGAAKDGLLSDLNLSRTKVGDEGIAALARLKWLRRLDLRATAVTDEGLAMLPPDLEEIDLGDTGVGDAGMEKLSGHAHLEALTLDRTQVTDAGLVPLGRLPRLRTVSVSGSRVTSAGEDRFAGRHPGVTVHSPTRPAVTRGGLGGARPAGAGAGS